MVKVTQEELQRIDDEITVIKKEKFTVQNYLSWLQMRGAISLDKKGQPAVIMKKENGELLYNSLRDKFEVYTAWKRNGKKLKDLGNFGIDDNQSSEQANKGDAQKGPDLQDDF